MLKKIKQATSIKWLFCFSLALLLNFLAFYFITNTALKTNNHTLTLALQNQNDSNKALKEEIKYNIGTFGKVKKQKNKTLNKVQAKPKLNGNKNQSKIIYKANVKKRFNLQYPQSALNREIEGKVILHILVNNQGVPVKIKTAQSSGFAILDKAAKKAAKQWIFEPLNVQEKNVELTWITIAIEYKITNQNKV